MTNLALKSLAEKGQLAIAATPKYDWNALSLENDIVDATGTILEWGEPIFVHSAPSTNAPRRDVAPVQLNLNKAYQLFCALTNAQQSEPLRLNATILPTDCKIFVSQHQKPASDWYANYQCNYARREEKLLSFKDLEAGWDGAAGIKPEEQHVLRLRRLMRDFNSYLIETPHPMVSVTGEVALYWRSDQHYAEIGIDSDGLAYVLAKADGNIVLNKESITLDELAFSSVQQFLDDHFSDREVANFHIGE